MRYTPVNGHDKHIPLYTDMNSVQFLLFLAQGGYTVLLRAAQNGHAEFVRMLLDEFGSSLDEKDTVSVQPPIPSVAPEVT